MRNVFMVLLALALVSCASRGREITPEMANSIVVGQTTKDQMVETFGAPISQGYNDAGLLSMTWFYVYVGYANIGSRQQNLVALFGDDGKVKKFNFSDTDPDSAVRLGK